MDITNEKPLIWIGTSLKDLKEFPKDVQSVMGYALNIAQIGGKADSAKPLPKVVTGGRILEILDDFDGNTYRAVYTAKFEKAVYALHVFQKKSKKGISTPKQDIELIKARFKRAEEHYKLRYEGK